MPGFNPENINIHDLTIEEPEKQETFFDPEKEITREDWEAMKDQLDECRRKGDVFSFASRAAAMKIIKPEMRIQITDAQYENIKKSLEGWRKSNLSGFFQFAMSLKIIDPEFDIGPYVGDQSEIRNDFQEKKNNAFKIGEFIGMAAKAKVVAPIRVGENSIEPETWEKIREHLRNSRKKLTRNFTEKASQVKILNPKEDLNLTQEDWDEMSQLLRDLRGDDMYNFSEQAMAMKILAAEKVEITAKGLEITMPKRELSATETPPVPETKNF